jgi:hypothetical protein
MVSRVHVMMVGESGRILFSGRVSPTDYSAAGFLAAAGIGARIVELAERFDDKVRRETQVVEHIELRITRDL